MLLPLWRTGHRNTDKCIGLKNFGIPLNFQVYIYFCILYSLDNENFQCQTRYLPLTWIYLWKLTVSVSNHTHWSLFLLSCIFVFFFYCLATPGVKREPQWRQELKKRQELMQLKSSEQYSSQQESLQPASNGRRSSQKLTHHSRLVAPLPPRLGLH